MSIGQVANLLGFIHVIWQLYQSTCVYNSKFLKVGKRLLVYLFEILVIFELHCTSTSTINPELRQCCIFEHLKASENFKVFGALMRESWTMAKYWYMYPFLLPLPIFFNAFVFEFSWVKKTWNWGCRNCGKSYSLTYFGKICQSP